MVVKIDFLPHERMVDSIGVRVRDVIAESIVADSKLSSRSGMRAVMFSVGFRGISHVLARVVTYAEINSDQTTSICFKHAGMLWYTYISWEWFVSDWPRVLAEQCAGMDIPPANMSDIYTYITGVEHILCMDALGVPADLYPLVTHAIVRVM